MSAQPKPVTWRSKDDVAAPFHAPLRDRVFRLYWFAATISLAAGWMHDAGAAWFMRELTAADPFMVSLIQAAASIPIMLLSLPMGTVGDMWDRRRLLIAANLIAVCVVALTFSAIVAGQVTPWRLVALTGIFGIAKAMLLPGLASIIPELLSRRELPLGVGLHSLSNNLARIAGPVLAGIIVAGAGIAAVYATDLFLLAGSLWLLLAWRRQPRTRQRKQGYLSELQAGLLFCLNDPAYRSLIGRVIVFFLCAASVHALLPVIVDDPRMFGISWSAFGVGAVAGAIVFPRFSGKLSFDAQLNTGIGLHAALLGLLAIFSDEIARLVVLVLLGTCWFLVMSAAQVRAQLILPEELRARGMGAFVVVIIAGVGLGAPLWGFVAKLHTPVVSLLVAVATSLVALLLTHRLGRSA